MKFDLIAMIAITGLALVPLLYSIRRTWIRVLLVAVWAYSANVLVPWYREYRADHVSPPVENRPVEMLRGEYVGSKACGACHPHEYDTWTNTWHRTMTQVATPDSVVGDFDGVSLQWLGWKTDLQQRGDKFFARVYQPRQGHYVWREVVMTTGSHHMQAYWYSRGPNRALGQLEFTYLIEDHRWVPRSTVFLEPPRQTPVLETGRWNETCIFCHTTRGRPGIFDNFSDEARSDAVEFGIACEACHGPGGDHVRANRESPIRRYSQYVSEGGDSTIVNAKRLPKERSVEVCAQCHGISTPQAMVPGFYERGFDYVAGDVLDETGRSILRGGSGEIPPSKQVPDGLHDSFFWPDGVVRVSGREANGLYVTPCYQRGEMTCLSCHRLHQSEEDPRTYRKWADDTLARGMRTDQACLQCHEAYASDVSAHTRHAPDSSGSECMNCHMPYTTWGLMKAIRQHVVNSPTVTSDLESGRSNACNSCHLDRTLAWTAKQLNAWYGQPIPELSDDDRTIASSLRWLTKGDAGQRALAAWSLGWAPAQEASGTRWMAPHLAGLLDDPYPVVRYTAGRSLGTLPGFEAFEYDYVAPRSELVSAKREAREIHADWLSEAGRTPGFADASRAQHLLFFADGSFDRVSQRELRSERDDRRINLLE